MMGFQGKGFTGNDLDFGAMSFSNWALAYLVIDGNQKHNCCVLDHILHKKNTKMAADRVDTAIRNLVVAMVGHEDPESTSLAKRVLGSQFGRDDDRNFGSHSSAELSSIWRRIGRKGPDANCRRDLEEMYERLGREFASQNEPHLSPKLLMVLSKLMGKRMILPDISTTPRNAPPVRNTFGMAPTSTRNATPDTQLSENSMRNANITPSFGTAPIPIQHGVHVEKKELEQEEALVLRECLYSLQGIDGERIRYYHKESGTVAQDSTDSLTTYDGVRVKSPAMSHALLYSGRVLETRLGSGAMDALRMAGEAGWLYNRIQRYIHEVQQDKSKGIVARALAGTLGDVLRDYHSLLTEYESRLATITLRQLLVDLRSPMARLRTLALVTDGSCHLTGGNLLSALHQHALHGNTRHAKQVEALLCASSRPWFEMLYAWTTQGLLSDPHNEFFVSENKNVKDKNLWKDKYSINKDHIPEGILEKELVGPAFNVGKGINFIRKCLLDGKWSMRLETKHDEEATTMTVKEDLGYRYVPHSEGNLTLQRSLSQAADLVHTHILRTLRQEFCMMDHLFALKQFLFLGQGDFFSALMDGLHSEFREQPGVAGIYKHSLLATVEGALRSSNAKYLPQHVLDRLQVELLLDPDDAENGMFGPAETPAGQKRRTVWDIFMLDYQVPDPLIAILHTTVLEKYKMVFSLLFNLKRVEFMLNFTWRQSATLQHALQNYGQYNGIQVTNSPTYAQAVHLLRTISILRQNMMHLIVNLKSYFMFEVIEGGWQQLVVDLDAAKTLDEVIQAHDRYIDGIVRKSLVPTENTKDALQRGLSTQVDSLLKITGEFCDFQEELFHSSLSAADIASEKRREADRRANQGRWGFDSEQDITEEENFFGLANHKTMDALTRISKIYNHNALELLRILGDKVNSSLDDLEAAGGVSESDMLEEYGIVSTQQNHIQIEDDLDPQRFLISQLDHNGFYGQQLS